MISSDEAEANVNNTEIQIIPNRRQLDNKFPVLGFTVKTGNLPFFEVIVTTEAKYFAPERAAERRAENFFSSRQSSGQLQAASNSDAVYVVPASVLNSFAQNDPKPSAIYYTLIAYQTASGEGAQFANSPDSLANSAPSIELAPSFTGQTLSRVLGINCDSMRRVEQFSHSASFSNSYQTSAFDYGSALNEDDAGEGEDGFSLMKSLDYSTVLEDYNQDETHAEDGYEYNRNEYQTAQNYQSDYSSNNHYALSDDDDYEDGFEEELGAADRRFSQMQESVFPKGASEPDALYDEESEYYGESESFEDWEKDYAAPQSSSDYRDSEYEYSGAPAVSSNGYQTNGNGRKSHQQNNYYSNSYCDDYEEDYGESYSAPQRTARAAETGECSEDIANKRRIAAHKKVIEAVAKFESADSKYKAINADTEFEKLTWHSAYQKYHIGLSYGIVQFTQDSGSLGKLLKMMRARDKATFDSTFGGEKLADELIKVTNASGKSSSEVAGGRSARVQPVNGTDIWLPPWKARFEAAGDVTVFQGAQNELANDEYLVPILPFCQNLGLNTDRAVAMVYDRSVQMGVSDAKKFIIGAVGPISTTALQTQALSALGKKDIKQFQVDFGGLDTDGKWGPATHAAMVSALRALGSKSPIPIPTREQMLDSIVRAASGEKWKDRVTNLRSSTVFDDSAFPF